MKVSLFFQLFILIVFTIFISCSNDPDLSGEWKGSGGVYQLTISKNGNTYMINWHGSIHSSTYSGKYENGKINVGGGFIGDPIYSEDTHKIYWMGEEWTRNIETEMINNPTDLKTQLAAQMIKDAYNPEWFKKCMEDAGGIDKVVGITKVLLNNSGGQQYLLDGMPPCAFGARSSMYWIYEDHGGVMRLLADIGAADNVTVSPQATNGYFDIEISAGGNSFHWQYNGSKYKQVD